MRSRLIAFAATMAACAAAGRWSATTRRGGGGGGDAVSAMSGGASVSRETTREPIVKEVEVVKEVEKGAPEAYALIVPAHSRKQVDVMKVTWGLFPPCGSGNATTTLDAPVDLIFMSDAALEPLDVPGASCFRKVYRLRPFIPSCYDQYAFAPPFCFFTMMLHLDLDRDYRSILQVEADSVPVRKDWLAPALERVLKPTTGDVWVHGAKNAHNQNHFNGNGAFNLQNKEFRTFVKDYREWFFTVAVKSGDTAFDTNMMRYAIATGVADDFGNNHLHQAPGIRNCDLMSVVQCGKAHDASTWGLGPRDEALFVHSHDFKEPGAIERQVIDQLLGERAQTETGPS